MKQQRTKGWTATADRGVRPLTFQPEHPGEIKLMSIFPRPSW
jgi:hypothetical protein